MAKVGKVCWEGGREGGSVWEGGKGEREGRREGGRECVGREKGGREGGKEGRRECVGRGKGGRHYLLVPSCTHAQTSDSSVSRHTWLSYYKTSKHTCKQLVD